MVDKIICRSLAYECHIGFHDFEMGIAQEVEVDFEAEVTPITQEMTDRVDAITLDYFLANQKISQFLAQRRFNLIETAAEGIAELLLREFPIEAVQVTLTKKPLDTPNIESVSYQCHRTQHKKI